jgi:hypothetical protein
VTNILFNAKLGLSCPAKRGSQSDDGACSEWSFPLAPCSKVAIGTGCCSSKLFLATLDYGRIHQTEKHAGIASAFVGG